jgi:hypothetical protein
MGSKAVQFGDVPYTPLQSFPSTYPTNVMSAFAGSPVSRPAARAIATAPFLYVVVMIHHLLFVIIVVFGLRGQSDYRARQAADLR